MKIFNKDSKRGFTLIELLVVIAIIGLLAAIVLVALGGARDRARDARIMMDMTQIRTQGEVIFSTANNYDNVDCAIDNIKILCDDIASQGGTKPSDGSPGIDIITSASPADKYCAKVQLNSGKFWCVDYELRSAQYGTDPLCRGGADPKYTCGSGGLGAGATCSDDGIFCVLAITDKPSYSAGESAVATITVTSDGLPAAGVGVTLMVLNEAGANMGALIGWTDPNGQNIVTSLPLPAGEYEVFGTAKQGSYNIADYYTFTVE